MYPIHASERWFKWVTFKTLSNPNIIYFYMIFPEKKELQGIGELVGGQERFYI